MRNGPSGILRTVAMVRLAPPGNAARKMPSIAKNRPSAARKSDIDATHSAPAGSSISERHSDAPDWMLLAALKRRPDRPRRRAKTYPKDRRNSGRNRNPAAAPDAYRNAAWPSRKPASTD